MALLQQRGLLLPDVQAAQLSLRYIGYYRLSAYMRPFQSTDGTHQFTTGTTFERIADLYSFDRKLRIIFLDALDRIEVGLKSAITEALCLKHGPHWYLNSQNFLPTADHNALLKNLKEEIGHHDTGRRAVHVAHYYDNYDEPDMPPSWMLFEAISFGSFAHVIRRLNAANLKSVAWLLGITDPALKSWCLSLSYLRNLCAHHSRIWNRTYTIKPLIMRQYQTDMTPNDKTYAQAITLRVLLKQCSGPSNWIQRLSGLFAEHPNVELAKMGFPPDWSTRVL